MANGTNPESHAGAIAWGVLGAGVVAYDVLCPKGQTLSETVDRVLENPRTRYVAYAVGAVVASHLFNFLPDSIDPIHKTWEALENLEDTL